MSRRTDHELADELPDIASGLDRAANWVSANPAAFLAGIGLILALAAGIGLTSWWSERSELRAAEAVASVRSGFYHAMGAQPGATRFTEPANPETGRKAREEYAGRFAEAAAAHPGTGAAVDAWIQAGNLREELGQPDQALEAWKRAVAEAPPESALRGLALERLAVGYEAQGAWAEAGAAHEEAANIAAFPLRHYAMADAARSFAAAGDIARARTLADRVLAEAPDLALPDFVKARLDEIRAQQ
jgi:tetratricopeptide (TPR) repeat protein